MDRRATKQLLNWQQKPNHKPLLVSGARQVGKTYTIRQFGQDHYNSMVYLNFEFDARLNSIFETDLDPRRIIREISALRDIQIKPRETIIILDEIQACPRAITALKYFHEMAPEYDLIAAGSLMGVRIAGNSFPVGKVDRLQMYPLTFSEFLAAQNLSALLRPFERAAIRRPDINTHMSLLRQLKNYFLVGGMPEVVDTWLHTSSIGEVDSLQKRILADYQDDFAKYTSASEANRISSLWRSIPSQLSRENKKFLYQTIKTGARAREYESALDWLKGAGLIHQIYLAKKPAFPLVAYQDLSAFKIYFFDIGLLRQMVNLSQGLIIDGNRLFTEFKGMMAENFVINSLLAADFDPLLYYTFDKYEVDLLTQYSDQIVPIEIKSGLDHKQPSLTQYCQKHATKLAVRFSLENVDKRDCLLNLPLYATDATPEYFRRLLLEGW